jgi:hypothetical protein
MRAEGAFLTGAHAAEASGFQNAQQLGLMRSRKTLNFVEKKCAGTHGFEMPDAGLGRAGVGTAFGAEKLRLEELLRDGRDVDGEKGSAGMKSLGAKFLAAAGFAFDEDIDRTFKAQIEQVLLEAAHDFRFTENLAIDF